MIPKIKKNNPKGDIRKEIVGEVVGFNKEESSEAANLVCNLTGDNEKNTMSFGTEAGLFQDSGISTVICGPGSIKQAHTVDEYITFDQLKKCLTMLISLKEKSAFVESDIKNDIQIVKSFYNSLGFYSAEVEAKSQMIGNDEKRLNLIFSITKGEKYKIAKINFIGDKKVKNKRLRDVIASEEHRFWKFMQIPVR